MKTTVVESNMQLEFVVQQRWTPQRTEWEDARIFKDEEEAWKHKEYLDTLDDRGDDHESRVIARLEVPLSFGA